MKDPLLSWWQLTCCMDDPLSWKWPNLSLTFYLELISFPRRSHSIMENDPYVLSFCFIFFLWTWNTLTLIYHLVRPRNLCKYSSNIWASDSHFKHCFIIHEWRIHNVRVCILFTRVCSVAIEWMYIVRDIYIYTYIYLFYYYTNKERILERTESFACCV